MIYIKASSFIEIRFEYTSYSRFNHPLKSQTGVSNALETISVFKVKMVGHRSNAPWRDEDLARAQKRVS